MLSLARGISCCAFYLNTLPYCETLKTLQWNFPVVLTQNSETTLEKLKLTPDTQVKTVTVRENTFQHVQQLTHNLAWKIRA